MGLLGLYPEKGSAAISDQWERSGTRKYRAAFTLDCDEVFARDNLGSALKINAPHPSDPGMVVSNIAVDQTNERSRFADPNNPGNLTVPNFGVDCFWWDVDITFGAWDPLEHSPDGNPVNQPVDFGFSWQVFEQPCDVAINPDTGKLVPVVNSAGDPFDPGVTKEQLKGVLKVAWNALTFNPASFFALGNCINEDNWNGFDPYTIKFSPPNMPKRLWSQYLGRNYYRLEGEFCFNPNDMGWNARPIDRGFRARDGSGNLTKIFDAIGQPVSQPVLLDGNGGILAYASLGNYYEWNFQRYNSITFSSSFTNLNNLFS